MTPREEFIKALEEGKTVSALAFTGHFHGITKADKAWIARQVRLGKIQKFDSGYPFYKPEYRLGKPNNARRPYDMSEYARTYPSDNGNPAAFLNGFTTVLPWESWEIDQHPDAQRIWATIATYQRKAFEDGEDRAEADMLETDEELTERVRSETLEEVLSVLRRLNLCVLNDDLSVGNQFYDGELADYEDILQFLEDSSV